MIGKYLSILAFIIFSGTISAATECPVESLYKDKTCDGAFVAHSMTDLLNYKQTLGFKNKKIKSLVIDFNLNASNNLSISTNCKILISENRQVNVQGKLCLHGEMGVRVESSSKLSAENIRIESNNRVFLSERVEVTADNFTIESTERAVIGSDNIIDVDNLFGMYTVGSHGKETDSIIRENSKIKADKIEIVTNEELRLGKNVRLDSVDLTLNASVCKISEEKIAITATNRFGNCFLQSSGKHRFTVDRNSGYAPLNINFDASKIEDANYFFWEFGDGQTLTTTNKKVSHLYNQVGTYTAKLKYAKGYNSKNKKYIEVRSAGYIQINVKVQPNLEPVSSLSCSVNNLLVTCNGLASYDPEGFPLSYKFIYGDNFVEENSIGLSTHAFSQEGLTTVQLIVTDNLGLSNSTSIQVMPVRPPNQLPEIAFSCISKSPWSIECNANGTKDNDGSISLLTVIYDDQNSENFLIENNFSHTFSSGGTHNLKVVAIDNDGGVSELTKSISVLENTPPTVSDSDNNGIRDDLQRFISIEAKDNIKYKEVISDYAKVLNSEFSNKSNSQALMQLNLKKSEIEYCLQSVLNNDSYFNNVQTAFYILNYNSELRHLARIEIDSNLNGMVSEVVDSSTDKSIYCDLYKTR
jgi:PKD repeat protein